jgi:hypothetical protein
VECSFSTVEKKTWPRRSRTCAESLAGEIECSHA